MDKERFVIIQHMKCLSVTINFQSVCKNLNKLTSFNPNYLRSSDFFINFVLLKETRVEVKF